MLLNVMTTSLGLALIDKELRPIVALDLQSIIALFSFGQLCSELSNILSEIDCLHVEYKDGLDRAYSVK